MTVTDEDREAAEALWHIPWDDAAPLLPHEWLEAFTRHRLLGREQEKRDLDMVRATAFAYGFEDGEMIGRRKALEDAAELVERRGAELHARAVDVPRTAAAIRAMIEGGTK